MVVNVKYFQIRYKRTDFFLVLKLSLRLKLSVLKCVIITPYLPTPPSLRSADVFQVVASLTRKERSDDRKYHCAS